MDDLYNDLAPQAQGADDATPPATLSPAEQRTWIEQRLAATKAWETLLTPAYFKQSQGPRLGALESQLQKLDLETATPDAPGRPKPPL